MRAPTSQAIAHSADVISLFAGLRPWEFSELTRLRRKAREKFF